VLAGNVLLPDYSKIGSNYRVVPLVVNPAFQRVANLTLVSLTVIFLARHSTIIIKALSGN
jgi:hypothetical protein